MSMSVSSFSPFDYAMTSGFPVSFCCSKRGTHVLRSQKGQGRKGVSPDTFSGQSLMSTRNMSFSFAFLAVSVRRQVLDTSFRDNGCVVAVLFNIYDSR